MCEKHVSNTLSYYPFEVGMERGCNLNVLHECTTGLQIKSVFERKSILHDLSQYCVSSIYYIHTILSKNFPRSPKEYAAFPSFYLWLSDPVVWAMRLASSSVPFQWASVHRVLAIYRAAGSPSISCWHSTVSYTQALLPSLVRKLRQGCFWRLRSWRRIPLRRGSRGGSG